MPNPEPPDSGRTRSPDGWIPRAVAVCVALLYLGTVPLVFPGNMDALSEQWLLDGEESQPRVQHLALTWTYRLTDRSLGFLPRTVSLGLWNLAAGLLSLVLLYRCARLAGFEPGISALATACAAFSWVHWEHAIESESAMIGEFFLLLAFWMVLRTAARVRGLSPPALLAGVCLAVASLYSLNLAFYLPVLILMSFQQPGRTTSVRMGAGIALSLPLVLVWGGILLWAALHPGGASQALHIRGAEDLMLGDLLSAGRALRSASGFANGFVLSDFGTAVRMGYLELADPFLAAQAARFAVGGALSILVLAGLGAMLSHRGMSPTLGIPVLLLFAITAVFGYLWLGSDPQFWLTAVDLGVLPLAMLSSWIARGRRLLAHGLLILAAILLCLLNFKGRTPCVLSPGGGREWKAAEEVAARVPDPGIVLDATRRSGGYLRHFFPDRYRLYIDLYYDREQGEDSLARLESALADGSAILLLPDQPVERIQVQQELEHLGMDRLIGMISARIEGGRYLSMKVGAITIHYPSGGGGSRPSAED